MAKGKSNKLRIIGGEHRGRVLRFPDVKGLRPTADRVRETLFNWLQSEISDANCLDLFAGSGALGLEALSRGANHVTFVDQSRPAIQQLIQNIHLLNVENRALTQQQNSLKLLSKAPIKKFNIVFIDPPFADNLLSEACQFLEKNHWLTDEAWVYLEQDSAHTWPQLPPNWETYREALAGQAACRLIKRVGS